MTSKSKKIVIVFRVLLNYFYDSLLGTNETLDSNSCAGKISYCFDDSRYLCKLENQCLALSVECICDKKFQVFCHGVASTYLRFDYFRIRISQTQNLNTLL